MQYTGEESGLVIAWGWVRREEVHYKQKEGHFPGDRHVLKLDRVVEWVELFKFTKKSFNCTLKMDEFYGYFI